VGAEVAEDILQRLRVSRETSERVIHLVRQHMFRYEPEWTDTAVRRFIGKVGPAALDDVLALREADNVGSGLSRDAGELPELRRRIAAEIESGLALDRSGLALHGDDLIRELGLRPGPALGRLLDRLVERVIADPQLNHPEMLLRLARELSDREQDASDGRPVEDAGRRSAHGRGSEHGRGLENSR